MRAVEYNWLRHLVLPLGLAAMETCWVYPWALVVGAWLQPELRLPLLSPLTIFALLIVAYAASRLVLNQDWSLRRAQASLTVAGLAAALLSVYSEKYRHLDVIDFSWLVALGGEIYAVSEALSPPFLSFALALYLWWRGMRQGRSDARFEEFETGFVVGVIALAACLVLTSLTSPTTYASLQNELSSYVLGYLLIGLTSLSLARLEATRERGRVRSGHRLSLSPQWLAAMVGVVVAVLLLALGLAQLFSPGILASALASFVDLAWSAVWLLVMVIAVPIGLLMEGILLLVRSILRPLQPPEQVEPIAPSPLEDVWPVTEPQGLPPEMVTAIRLIVAISVCVAALLWLARALRARGREEHDDEVVEERDSIATWQTLMKGFLAWLNWLLSRVMRKATADVSTEIKLQPEVPTEAPGVANLRKLYRELLRLGASLGVARARSTTPYEYQIRLQSRLEPMDDVAYLTEVYVQARYGHDPPGTTIELEAEARWNRLKHSALGTPQEQDAEPSDVMDSD